MNSFEMIYILGGTLLHSLWQGLLIAGCTWLLLRVLRTETQFNAAARYTICTSALVAMVAVMGITAWRAPVENNVTQHVAPRATPNDQVAAWQPPSRISVENEAQNPVPVSQEVPEVPEAKESIRGAEPVAVVRAEASSEAPAGLAWQLPRWRLNVPGPFRQGLPVLLGLWLLGMGVVLDRLIRSYLYLRRLKQTSKPLPLAARRVLDGLIASRRPVQIRVAPALTSPVAAGLTNPMVLLPPSLLEDLTPEHLSQVVLHELAHLERWDDWTNLMQQIVEAVLFFNPAVHVLGRHMERYRELACDDWVVARTSRPRAYASCLTRLIELDLRTRTVRVAPGMAVRKEHVFERVRRLLDPRHATTAPTPLRRTITVAGLLLLLLVGVAFMTPVFALSSEPPPALPTPETASHAPTPATAPHATSQPAPRPEPSAPAAEVEVATSEETPNPGGPMPPVAEADATDASETILLSLEPEHLATLPTPTPAQHTPLAEAQDLSVKAWLRVFKSAEGISSSGDRARFLIEAARRVPENAEVHAAYMQAAQTIGSSGDRKRALEALLVRPLGNASLHRMLAVVKEVSSSGDKAALLIQIAKKLPDDETLRDAFFDVAESLPSSSDYRRVMEAATTSWR